MPFDGVDVRSAATRRFAQSRQSAGFRVASGDAPGLQRFSGGEQVVGHLIEEILLVGAPSNALSQHGQIAVDHAIAGHARPPITDSTASTKSRQLRCCSRSRAPPAVVSR